MRKRGDVVLWGSLTGLIVGSSSGEGQFCQLICWNDVARVWTYPVNVYPHEVILIGELCLD